MFRSGLLVGLVLLAACGNNKGRSEAGGDGGGELPFAAQFRNMEPPYSMSDSALAASSDTATLRAPVWNLAIPDSVEVKLFGGTSKVRYTPVGRFTGKKKETYFLVRGVRGNRRAALLAVAAVPDSVTAVLPFLAPDNDPATRQVSTLEANFSVTRATTKRLPDDAVRDGRDVFAYSEIGRTFDLVLTDPLDDKAAELLNPIDTLGKTYKWAGDYSRDKRNLVSVRDGRKSGLITVFIHLEKNDGACTGEIKGDAEITDETTAVYRTAGDPCVLTLKFGKNAVTLQEEEGCGSRRGLECSFDGQFNKTKAAAGKSGKAK